MVLMKKPKFNIDNFFKELLKEKEISEDQERQGEDEMQKLTDLFVTKAEETLAMKEKDLLDF